MGSDTRLLLMDRDPSPEDDEAWEARKDLFRDGGWIEISDTSPYDAEKLSRRLRATVVSLDLQTTVDQIWLKCFESGKQVRELCYSSDDGWTVQGARRRFEDKRALDRWLKKRDLLASPDGYDVLDAFLGKTRGEKDAQSGYKSLSAKQLKSFKEWMEFGADEKPASLLKPKYAAMKLYDLSFYLRDPFTPGKYNHKLPYLPDEPDLLRESIKGLLTYAHDCDPRNVAAVRKAIQAIKGERDAATVRKEALAAFEEAMKDLDPRTSLDELAEVEEESQEPPKKSRKRARK